MHEYKKVITDKLDRRALLEQLAEECAELSQAALKCIRAEGLSDNATTTSARQAKENLVEEVGDVLMVCDALGLMVDGLTKNNPKWQRWAKRLESDI